MKTKRKYRKKKLGSYPFFTVIFSITLSLCIAGIAGLLFVHGQAFTSALQRNVKIDVFLENNLSTSQLDKLKTVISSKPYILIEDRKAKFEYISRDEALKRHKQDTGEDPMEVLEVSPLKAHLSLMIDPQFANVNALEKIKKELEGYTGVFQVSFDDNKKAAIKSLNEYVKIGALVLSGISIISFLIIVLLINNTIKLAMFSQRFLIRSMQLVGAKGSFIQRPFLQRTTLHGLLSGVIASIVLHLLLLYIYKDVEDMEKVKETVPTVYIFMVYIGLCLLGVLIGLLSSFRAVKKYLRMSLDDLH